MASIAARRTLTSRILIPREHGAWAMLLMPYLIGTGVSGAWAAPQGLLFLSAAVCCFSARYPLALAIKQHGTAQRAIVWTAIYCALAASSGLTLLFAYGRWYVLPLAVVALSLMALQQALRAARLDRSTAGELIAFAGLVLTGPGVYYAISGRLDVIAASIWLLSFLYAGASVFYVRLRGRQRPKRAANLNLWQRVQLGGGLAAYQGCSIILLVLLAVSHQIPTLAPLAFAPLTIKVARDILTAAPQLNLRRLGLLEVGHSVAFTALLIAAYAL